MVKSKRRYTKAKSGKRKTLRKTNKNTRRKKQRNVSRNKKGGWFFSGTRKKISDAREKRRTLQNKVRQLTEEYQTICDGEEDAKLIPGCLEDSTINQKMNTKYDSFVERMKAQRYGRQEEIYKNRLDDYRTLLEQVKVSLEDHNISPDIQSSLLKKKGIIEDLIKGMESQEHTVNQASGDNAGNSVASTNVPESEKSNTDTDPHIEGHVDQSSSDNSEAANTSELSSEESGQPHSLTAQSVPSHIEGSVVEPKDNVCSGAPCENLLHTECVVDDSSLGYSCLCQEGWRSESKDNSGNDKSCFPQPPTKPCQEETQEEINILELKIKEQVKDLEAKAKKEEEEEEKKPIVDGGVFINTFISVKHMFDVTKKIVKNAVDTSLEKNKEKLRELHTEQAKKCLKEQFHDGLVDKIVREKKLFEVFEKLEIEKLKKDFRPLYKIDEMKELEVFVISSDNGDIKKNDYTGIKNARTYLTLETSDIKYEVLENAYLRYENGGTGRIIKKTWGISAVYENLDVGTQFISNFRKTTNENGDLVRIKSIENQGDKYEIREGQELWVKMFNNGRNTVRPIEILGGQEEISIEGYKRNDIDYELKAGDILIIPHENLDGSDSHVSFSSEGPDYFVSFKGDNENPIYIKSQIGEPDIKVFTDSIFKFKMSQLLPYTPQKLIGFNRNSLKKKLDKISSYQIRRPTIDDLMHIFNEAVWEGKDRDGDYPIKNTDFSLPFLNNISLLNGDEKTSLILQEFLLQIIENLRKDPYLESTQKGLYKLVKAKDGCVAFKKPGEKNTILKKYRGEDIIRVYNRENSPVLFGAANATYILTSDGLWINKDFINEIQSGYSGSAKTSIDRLDRVFKSICMKSKHYVEQYIEKKLLYDDDTGNEAMKKNNIYKLLGMEPNEKGFTRKFINKLSSTPTETDTLSPPDKSELSMDFFYCGIFSHPIDIYALPPPCSGISKSNLSITDDIIYYDINKSVRDGKKLLKDDSKEPSKYVDNEYVGLDCKPKLLLNDEGERNKDKRLQEIQKECGPPFNRISGLKPYNDITKNKGPKKRTCLNIDDIYKRIGREDIEKYFEVQKNMMLQKFQQGYGINSSEVKVIKRHMIELDSIISLYDTIDSEKRDSRPVRKIEASKDKPCEIIGFYVDKYACLLNAYNYNGDMDDDVVKKYMECKYKNHISELNRNEKLVQKFYPNNQSHPDAISEQKYNFFGLPSDQYSDHKFIRNIAWRRVGENGERGEKWNYLHSDFAVSITDIRSGVGAGSLKIKFDLLKDYMRTVAGRILIAGAMSFLKKGFSMVITKVLKVLIMGPLGFFGGGGGMKMITNDKYHIKQKRTKRTKRRRKKKITKKCSMKSNIK